MRNQNRIRSPQEFRDLVRNAAGFVARHFTPSARHAIILGTGAGLVAESIDASTILPFTDIPGFPASTALGHQGKLVCGTLHETPILAMQGRFHLYEGYDVDLATLPIHVMHELGINTLIVSNASGGLNPKFQSGEIMLIESHIDLLFRTSPHLFQTAGHQRSPPRADAYNRRLIERALACGRRHNFPVHRGVYAAMLGPNYETRAEYRMLRRIGADAAGMSTVPEVTVATRYQMRVLGLSVITNIAKPDVLESTSGHEVIAAAQTAAPALAHLIADAIQPAR